MTETKERVINELVAWADLDLSHEEFDGRKVRQENPELYALAQNAFGSWSAALGAALTLLAQSQSKPKSTDRPSRADEQKLTEPPEDREVGPDAFREGIVVRADGKATRLGLAEFFGSTQGVLADMPDGMSEDVIDFIPGEEDASLALLTRAGELVSLLREQFPAFSLQGRWNDYSSDESGSLRGWRDAVLRNKIRRHDRIYFFSRGGQVKASDAQEYARRVDSEGMPGIIIKEDDEAFAVTLGNKRARICVASSMAKTIVFEPEDVRTQGLKAQGVKAIGLDDGAHVVGAFLVENTEFFALFTEQGFCKLLDPDEFRSQGRGGGGLQTCRLANNDAVAVFAGTSRLEDMLLFTNRRRYVRVPSFAIEPMGRSARGEQLIQLHDGEIIIGGRSVPAGEFAE